MSTTIRDHLNEVERLCNRADEPSLNHTRAIGSLILACAHLSAGLELAMYRIEQLEANATPRATAADALPSGNAPAVPATPTSEQARHSGQ